MARKWYRRGGRSAANPPRRWRRRAVSGLSALLLGLVGASFDPAIVAPFGPLAVAPEEVSASFTRCGRGRSFACVVDGDTLRLGTRRIRMVGIDAPELVHPLCPEERALAERAADRLTVLVNQGPFMMIAHRFNRSDQFGRELMDVRRDGRSLGGQLIDDGLAHRYVGMKRSWC